ncbi:MAG TPA: hypothetical protein VGF55_23720 [Gemmataceae bacterium]|jgi:hypothetical protein
MAGIRFREDDPIILGCIPDQGCDLACILSIYTFVNRAAVPTYEEIGGCLSRAVRAGMMPPPAGGWYRLAPGWRARLHERDDRYSATEYGLFEVAEEFASQEWPELAGLAYTLDLAEYERAADAVGREHDRVFGSRAKRAEPGAAPDRGGM